QAAREVFAAASDKMVTLVFNKTGTTSDEFAALIQAAGSELIEQLLAWRHDKSVVAIQSFGGQRLLEIVHREDLNKILARAVDDFRHGIHGVNALKKDPVVSVTNTIANSPNAVLQNAVGDRNQQSVQQQDVHAMQRAVDDL